MNLDYEIIADGRGFTVKVGPKAFLPGIFLGLHHAETAAKTYMNQKKTAAAKRKTRRTKKEG